MIVLMGMRQPILNMLASSCSSPYKGHERRNLLFLAGLTFTLTIEFIYPVAAAADSFGDIRISFRLPKLT